MLPSSQFVSFSFGLGAAHKQGRPSYLNHCDQDKLPQTFSETPLPGASKLYQLDR